MHDKPCPHCGYCPTCGRVGATPIRPWGGPWTQPIYPGTAMPPYRVTVTAPYHSTTTNPTPVLS